MNKIIIFAPHPDDETLGCGGTLLKHIDNGDQVHWVIMTDIKESEGFKKQLINQRKREIKKRRSKFQPPSSYFEDRLKLRRKLIENKNNNYLETKRELKEDKIIQLVKNK